MAYNPISGFTLQVITSTGQVASDYYLKLYEANTTTPLSMATDSSGTTLLTKAKIGDKGMPVSNPLDNSTVFIPHVNASYRLVIYTSEADADANNTAEAYVNVPFVSTLLGASVFGTAAYLDTGTAAGEVPTNGDLGTAAQVDTGTAAGQVPTNADLGTAAQVDTGTGASEIPRNSDLPTFGTAAAADIGTAAGEVPTNSILASKGANYGKNLIINGDFSVNQRGVTGTVSLAPGEYGHDRFKAGSGGCTYTFATSAAVTTITITAGTLLQIIEGQTIEAKPIILSWEGTAQGRINIGSYGDSGEVTATSIAGADITVEFDTGTLSKTQLEFGDTVTEFEYVHPADQLARCQRYFEGILINRDGVVSTALAISTTTCYGSLYFNEKRDVPSISVTGAGTIVASTSTFVGAGGSVGFDKTDVDNTRVFVSGASGLSAGNASLINARLGSVFIEIEAEI